MTQTEMILEYLKRHGSITPLEALEECGSMRLSARIKELRDGGYNIVTVNVTHGRTTYARYVLLEDGFSLKSATAKNESVFTTVIATFDENEALKDLSSYDMAVHNAIGNLCYAALKYDPGADMETASFELSFYQIYKAMGISGSEDKKPANSQIDKIAASVKKMMTTLVTLDDSAEAKAQRRQPTYLTENVIYAQVLRGHKNAVKVEHVPALFRYSITRNEIFSLPGEAYALPLNEKEDNK